MKIKRFFAADIRQAMRMVKDELGADAVIMSNRSVDGGVEIVAARDFDEQLVHQNLLQDEQEQVMYHKTKNLKVEIPQLNTEKNSAQLLASQRKRNQVNTNPIRKNLDQYMGYAEKLQIGGMNSIKSPEKVKLVEKPLWAIPENKTVTGKENKSDLQQNAMPEQFMLEIRTEMKEIKQLLDSKLADIINHPVQNQASVRQALLDKLLESGFSNSLATKITNRLGSHKQFDLAFAKAQEMLTKILPISNDSLLEEGGIVALVGPTGVGKTTTIAKLAAQYILKHGSRDVALITTDNYRIGAHEQLGIYGRILGVSVKIANNATELEQHIHDFSNKRLILIDTVGMSQRDMRLAEQIQTLTHHDLPIKAYLVISATSQYKSVMEIINAFENLNPQAVILTKLDEAASKAMALSAIIERCIPLSFITDGQQVPEDIHTPQAEALIQKCMSSSDTELVYSNKSNQDSWLAENYA